MLSTEDTAVNKIVKYLSSQGVLGKTNNICHISGKCYEEEQRQFVDRRDEVILYRVSGWPL